jgi:hypothetical protein
MIDKEKEIPFWDNGKHPILGYYYNGGYEPRYYFYKGKAEVSASK